MDRRRALRLLRNGGIAAAVLGGAGVFGTRSVMATIAEHDLSRVGSEGKPKTTACGTAAEPAAQTFVTAAERHYGQSRDKSLI